MNQLIERNETRVSSFRHGVFFVFITGFLHLLFLKTNLYGIFLPLDIFIHGLGSGALMFLALTILLTEDRVYEQKKSLTWYFLAGVILVTIGAGLFEVVQQAINTLYPYKTFFIKDTIIDVFAGAVGAMCAGFWWIKFCVYKIIRAL